MEVIYTLIPGMVLIGLLMVGVLYWAVRKGQYEDFEGDAHRILLDEDVDEPGKKGSDAPSGEGAEPARRKHDPNWPDAD